MLDQVLTTLARSVWLILPVVAAGVGHVVVIQSGLLRPLAIPIDGGAIWRGRPVFGSNKTWRGLVVMAGLTALAMRGQAELARRSHRIAGVTSVDFQRVNPWPAGAVYGLGYTVGELPNSFVKRRLGIEPGGHSPSIGHWQYIIDQTDSVLGCLIALSTFHRPRRAETLAACFLGLGVHIGIDQALYVMGIKRRANVV